MDFRAFAWLCGCVWVVASAPVLAQSADDGVAPVLTGAEATADERPEQMPEIISETASEIPEVVSENAPQDELSIEAQLFARYGSTGTDGESLDAFTLDRAELGAMYRFGAWGAELRMEAIRSSGPQSVMGIDGDSLLMRLKRGWGYGRFSLAADHQVEVRAGLIPDAYKELLENDYDLRGLAPTMTERAGFFDTADLGAMVGYDGFDRRIRARFEVANGEGRNQVERNGGKNTTFALTVTPVAIRVHRGPLRISLHGAVRDGSVGVGSARNHRIAAGLTFVGPCPRAGFEFVRAAGYAGRGEQVARGWGVWANSYFATHWIGGAVRHDSVAADVDVVDGTVRRTTIALYSDLAGAVTSEVSTRPPLGLGFNLVRLYAAVELDRFQENAGALPGSGGVADTTRYMLMLQANGFRAWR